LERQEILFDPTTPNYEEILSTIIPDNSFVINCIGITNKRPSITRQEMFNINGVFPHILERICVSKKSILFHPTTDCVYKGIENVFHDEETAINCDDDYGISKYVGENMKNSCVIRTSIIGNEIVRKTGLLEWVRKTTHINGYTNHFWNGITCLEYAKMIEHLIVTKTYWFGIRHVYSPQVISKYELVKLITECYNLENIITETSCSIPVYRQLDSIFTCDYKIKSLKIQLEELREWLRSS